MALIIRFRQQGKTNRQSYRLVVTNRRSPRDGKYVEALGWYDPFAKGEQNWNIDPERILYWVNQGAILSERAKSLLRKGAPEVLKKLQEKKETKIQKVVAKKKKAKKTS